MNNCEFCDGPLFLLGVMGFTVHTRCQDCGYQFSVTDKLEAARAVAAMTEHQEGSNV